MIYLKIRLDLAKNLSAFHSFTDCDSTGRSAGKLKVSYYKLLLKSSPRIVDAFKKLGKTIFPPEMGYSSLKEFVWELYYPGERLSNLDTVR